MCIQVLIYTSRLSPQSTNESAISAAKSLDEVKLQGTSIIITTGGTTVLAGATVWLAISGRKQTRIMNQNMLDQQRMARLAYGPLIWPRFKRRLTSAGLSNPTLWFENIGNGAALNVDIEMTLASGQTERFHRFAFSHHLEGSIDMSLGGGFGVESHNTGINLNANPRIPTRIKYQDVTGEPYEIVGTIIFQNDEVRFEEEHS